MIATPSATLDNREHGETAVGAPGLRAALVYLRPVPRRQLLSILADLGVFVTECPDAALALHCASRLDADIVVVVGDDDPRHAQLAHDLRRALSAVLVAVVPAGTPTSAYRSAGASACVPDQEMDDEFAAHIELAALQARGLRGRGDLLREFVVFRDMILRMATGELVRNERTMRLTEAEKAALACLARSLDQPVAASELEQRVAAAMRSDVRRSRAPALVTQLRRKAGQLGGDAALLASIRRFGYILIG